MTDHEYAAALADAIDGFEDVCLGPTDIEIVVKALRTLAEGGMTVLTPSLDPKAA